MKNAFKIAFAIRLGWGFGTFVENVGYKILWNIFNRIDEPKHSVKGESSTEAATE